MKKLIILGILLVHSICSYGQYGVIINSKEKLNQYLDSTTIYLAYECSEILGIPLDSLRYVEDEQYDAYMQCEYDYKLIQISRCNFDNTRKLYKEELPITTYKAYPGTVKADEAKVIFLYSTSDSRVRLTMQYFY